MDLALPPSSCKGLSRSSTCRSTRLRFQFGCHVARSRCSREAKQVQEVWTRFNSFYDSSEAAGEARLGIRTSSMQRTGSIICAHADLRHLATARCLRLLAVLGTPLRALTAGCSVVQIEAMFDAILDASPTLGTFFKLPRPGLSGCEWLEVAESHVTAHFCLCARAVASMRLQEGINQNLGLGRSDIFRFLSLFDSAF